MSYEVDLIKRIKRALESDPEAKKSLSSSMIEDNIAPSLVGNWGEEHRLVLHKSWIEENANNIGYHRNGNFLNRFLSENPSIEAVSLSTHFVIPFDLANTIPSKIPYKIIKDGKFLCIGLFYSDVEKVKFPKVLSGEYFESSLNYVNVSDADRSWVRPYNDPSTNELALLIQWLLRKVTGVYLKQRDDISAEFNYFMRTVLPEIHKATGKSLDAKNYLPIILLDTTTYFVLVPFSFGRLSSASIKLFPAADAFRNDGRWKCTTDFTILDSFISLNLCSWGRFLIDLDRSGIKREYK